MTPGTRAAPAPPGHGDVTADPARAGHATPGHATPGHATPGHADPARTGHTAAAAAGRPEPGAGAERWELLRALGALTVTPPPASGAVSRALGLAEGTAADHTRLFVLDLPPYASIHLGPEGKLGGEGADRVAGLWRALSLDPPADADHLASLLWLCAELGAAAGSCRTEAARHRLEHARSVLLWEHLASWLPGYLVAAAPYPAAAGWSDLTLAALQRELAATAPAPVLPAALRDAPAPIGPDERVGDLIEAITVPVRTGFVLTARDVARAGAEVGVGVRVGERRFAMQAMLEQDPRATLVWLAGHARHWAAVHGAHPVAQQAAAWWAQRAAATADVLERLAADA